MGLGCGDEPRLPHRRFRAAQSICDLPASHPGHQFVGRFFEVHLYATPLTACGLYATTVTHSRAQDDEPFRDFQTDRRQSPRNVRAHPLAEWPGVSALRLHGRAYEIRWQETSSWRLAMQRGLRSTIHGHRQFRYGSLASVDPHLADGICDYVQFEEGR